MSHLRCFLLIYRNQHSDTLRMLIFHLLTNFSKVQNFGKVRLLFFFQFQTWQEQLHIFVDTANWSNSEGINQYIGYVWR